MIREEEVYKIGVFTKTHGISGELSFTFTDDVFDRVDAEFLVCKMDGIMVPFFMEEYRFKSDATALVKLEDIDSESSARRMVGVEVYFPLDLVGEETPEEYTWNYFTGFQVEDEEIGILGTIEYVNDETANVLFEVRRPDGNDLLIPAHEEFIVSVDHKGRHIVVSLPEGLLSLDTID